MASMANASLPLIAQSPTANPKRRRWRLLWITLLLPVAAFGLWRGLLAFSRDPSQSPGSEPRSLPARISALGRVAPEGEVVSITAPIQTGALAGARVEQLLVDSKRSRDTEASLMNMQLTTWRIAGPANTAFGAGVGDALRTWRQP